MRPRVQMPVFRAVLSLRVAWSKSVRKVSGCSSNMSDLVAGKRAAAERAVNELVKVGKLSC